MGKEMTTDPIFAAIAAWRLARKRNHAVDWKSRESEKLSRQYWTAARKMARTVPTTKAGAALMLAITTKSVGYGDAEWHVPALRSIGKFLKA